MKTDVILNTIDGYYLTLLLLHIFLSIFIAFIVSNYIKQRFVTTGHEHEDFKRLQLMTNKTHFHRLLFFASLHRNNTKSSFNYFFIFNFSMPVLGYMASLWYAWQLVHVTYQKKVIDTNLLNLGEFDISFLEVKRTFGEGAFNNFILNEHTPAQKKVYALNILSNDLTPVNLRIIKQSLSSTEDEVRMFGYAIINKAEQKVAKSINTEIELFKEADEKNNKEQVAASSSELAFLYWEMLYSELSNEILNDGFMEQVKHYITIAIELFTTQLEEETSNRQNLFFKLSRLHQLYGRYYLRLQEYDNAISEFTIAQELSKENATFVLPYTAEAYFYLGKYHIVKSLLNQVNLLEINSTVHPLINQWKKVV